MTTSTEDGQELTVVWEANSLVPKLFTDPQEAYNYRTLRQNQGRVKHQIYVQTSKVDEYAGVKRL